MSMQFTVMADGGLRKIFRNHLPIIHWCSIETSASEPGVPDMNGCINGIEFWIENKTTSGFTVALRPEQIGWMLRRTRCGGRSFIAVRRHCEAGPRRKAADELWLFSGASAERLQHFGLKGVVPLGIWEAGPARWHWDRINHLLMTEKPARSR
jgi:hypothetical protein